MQHWSPHEELQDKNPYLMFKHYLTLFFFFVVVIIMNLAMHRLRPGFHVRSSSSRTFEHIRRPLASCAHAQWAKFPSKNSAT